MSKFIHIHDLQTFLLDKVGADHYKSEHQKKLRVISTLQKKTTTKKQNKNKLK